MNPPRWRIAEPDPALAGLLARDLGAPPLFARCLANRGCDSVAAARRFLEPRLANLTDPFLLPGMPRAVDRLLAARATGEPFVIFGDYDVDGVTATALLTEFFSALGWTCSYYLPHRFDEGYGLTPGAAANCLEKFPVKILLAVDCGSSAAEVIRQLGARGVEVIVLDHHQLSSPPPPALALVNPQLLPGADDLHSLCSAGLAFKLAHALLKRGRELQWPEALRHDLREVLDFVALGTIADLVPLSGENRAFARAGLQRIAQSNRPGIQALKRAAGLNGSIDSSAVAFQLAPRLNAAGRLETALASLELLLARDASRAAALAEALDLQNRQRQSLEEHITGQALRALRETFNPERDFVIVDGRADWHLGVVGIVASRIAREFHRPTIILGGDGSAAWRGSGRSIEGFDLAASLRECSGLLIRQGGHAMAAGVTLDPTRLVDFRARLNEIARGKIAPELLQPTLRLDGCVKLHDLTFASLKWLEKLDPVGQENPPARFAARQLRLRGEPKRFGDSRQHVRFHVTDGADSRQAVWWSAPEHVQFPAAFDLAFAPELSEFNGTFGIQLKVLDLRPAAD